ncbi:hypothetical protein A2761_00070 [Candidatus Kaiserbacteria bacterium RIFCSPHIGHO2_01_FULL_51_33]|nr:MAG: hypothetical protein A2761_00070 [Candidatus Kaiserbacteria bacterium RIFCSPHIGHO2_01_FULL_51_33]
MKPISRRLQATGSQSGFIALISILIISFVLFYAVVSVSQRGIASRFLLLDIERKAASEKLAESCVQVVLIAVINDPSYIVLSSSPVSVPVGPDMCTIYSVSPSGAQSTIETKAVVSGATTNLRVIADNTTGVIVLWQEVPNLP